MDISVSSLNSGAERPPAIMRLPDLLRVLRRNLPVIVAFAVIAAVGSYAFAKTRVARYSAFGSIAIEGQSFAIPELEGAIRSDNRQDPMPVIRTEVQALTSRQLVQSVITTLGVADRPEFNVSIQRPSLHYQLLSSLHTQIPAIPIPDAPTQSTPETIQNEVLRSLTITQDNRSLAIGVEFTSEDPKLASDFVNALIQNYMRSKEQTRASANQSANSEMLQRVDDVRAGLTKIELQMRNLRTKNGLVGLRAGSVGQQQVEDLASAASRDSLERARLEAMSNRANTLALQGASGDLESVLSSQTISRLREQEAQSAHQLALLQANYGPNYPGILSAQATLQAAHRQVTQEQQRIVSSMLAQLSVARTREADTRQQLQAARNVSVKSENAQAELNDLQQEAVAQRTLYQSLLQGVQRTAAQSKAAPSLDVQVLSSAVPPSQPSSPNTKVAAAMGATGGLLLGVLFALVRPRPPAVVTTSVDLMAATGLGVAAVIPGARRSRQTLLAAVRASPSGSEAEALRMLRARLRTLGQPRAPRSVLFVSLHGEWEAAMVAAAFAYVAACDGEKVVLAEGNLANPRLAPIFGVEQSRFDEVLAGEADWYEALQSDSATGLDILVTPRPSPFAHALLSGTRFQNLLVDLHAAYNLSVLNSPPAEAADTLLLAAEAHATVLIVQAGRIPVARAHSAVARLAGMSRSHMTTVLTAAL